MLTRVSSNKCFGGLQERYKHHAQALGCEMTFGVYRPPAALRGEKTPVLWWLSGLTCTDENFVQKAGAQRIAAELGITVVAPDTSPRGPQVPGDPDGAWDFGIGAGFYVDATREPWSRNYRMHEYVVDELPDLVRGEFTLGDRQGIFGHSMGGHGALVCALRNPGRYRSVSAFAPITHPIESGWGQKAFSRFFGEDRKAWRAWDASVLLRDAKERLPILVDQGDADGFLDQQLQPQALVRAAEEVGHPLTLRMQPGYDHSYFFISTFMEDHLRHHAAALLP